MIEKTDIPEELVKEASGDAVFEQVNLRVSRLLAIHNYINDRVNKSLYEVYFANKSRIPHTCCIICF